MRARNCLECIVLRYILLRPNHARTTTPQALTFDEMRTSDDRPPRSAKSGHVERDPRR